ncbi:MAG: hypothetical protein AAFY88_31410, partial [Acidobacteriota bacterium]
PASCGAASLFLNRLHEVNELINLLLRFPFRAADDHESVAPRRHIGSTVPGNSLSAIDNFIRPLFRRGATLS